ncbi:hypothetical protein IEQ34_005202 [Dendrobium chrysotoxum]|uniref:Pectinesterase inhibitor domain-containing protein n=1 Tax=Dendrobium chrysotoxum TaxID=161865 RepID=A0AAV7HAE2_DENCH|nr:hypothetical protein IEQ34_005202 [Dendrobium chrysotoxum]
MPPATSSSLHHHLLLLFFILSVLHPSASICLPRGSTSPPPPPPRTSTPPPNSLPHPSPPTPTPTPSLPYISHLIEFFCNHTDFSDLCLKSLINSSTVLKSPTNSTVLAALMKAVDVKTHDARSFAQNLSADPHFDAKTRELLHDCIDVYDDALDNLEAAKEAISVGDIGTRDSMLSAMISNFGTCEDGFAEFSIKSPLEDWSETLQSMTDNCLAIINMNRIHDDY